MKNNYKLVAIIISSFVLTTTLPSLKSILEKEAGDIKNSYILKFPLAENIIGIKVENKNYKPIPLPIPPEQQGFTIMPQADYQEIFNSTSAWQTYRNNYFGFSIQYPAEMTFLPKPEPELQSQTKLIVDGGLLFKLEIQKIIDGNNSNDRGGIENKDCTEPFFGRTDIPAIHTKFGDGFDLSLMYTILTKKNSFRISWWDENFDRPIWDYDSAEDSSSTRSNEASSKEIEKEIAIRKLRIKILQTLTFDNPEDQPMKVICQIYP